MNETMNERTLSTADLVQASKAPLQDEDMKASQRRERDIQRSDETLVELFSPDIAQGFRSRWDEVQISFVDDPQQAVKKADELVAQVMTSLAETFSKERSELEGLMNDASETTSTENMRVALRRYRSFFQRLLSL
jgi:hypothetical protein